MIREAVVAGQFYPGNVTGLTKMIEKLIDKDAEKKNVIGMMVPHAGYPYSGPVAGATISRVKFGDTFIIMGPNHTGMGEQFSIMTAGTWQTPLGNVEIDSDLAKQILNGSEYLKEDSLAHQFEHSIEVQLPFLQYFSSDVKIVPIMLGYGSLKICSEIGSAIARVINSSEKDVIIIASGDMTHYESQATAQRKDKLAIESILNLDEKQLLERIDEENITMCGGVTASCLIVAAKILGAQNAELVKYQTSGDTTGDYASVVGYAGIIVNGKDVDPFVKLARETVERYTQDGKIIYTEEVPVEMKGKAGVFVSIHKGTSLRGCIGTFEPNENNIAGEIIVNAVSSATRDPRFSPITADELADLNYSVDVLTTPEPVESEDELDAKKYGVIVEVGWRRGLLLPDLEGVDSVEQQIDICRMKAGITPEEPVKLYRFRVERHKE